jgi:hypothetical protein
VQTIKLLIIKFSPLSCYLVPLRPKYSINTLFLNTFSLRYLISSRCGRFISFPELPKWLWGSHSHLLCRYWKIFPDGKEVGAWGWPLEYI